MRQTVFRTEASSNQQYTIINNKLLQDERLSDETRGLICKILSRPLDWEITVAGIIKSGKAGKDKVYRMVKEAKALGYMIDARKSSPGVKQTYAISDDPDFLEEKYARVAEAIEKEQNKKLPENPETSNKTNAGNPETLATLPENPIGSEATLPEKTFPGNPPQQIKDNITNKKTPSELQKPAVENFELTFDPPRIKTYDPKDFKTKHQLPEYWRVETGLRDWARNGKIGATDQQIDDQAEKFRIYHTGKGTTMKNWNSAFQTWMHNARDYGHLKPKQKYQNDRFYQMDGKNRA